jgi:hypothetical protein
MKRYGFNYFAKWLVALYLHFLQSHPYVKIVALISK